MTMLITVRLFAGLRQQAGTDRLTVELPDGTGARAAAEHALAEAGVELGQSAGAICALAINHDQVDDDVPLIDGDELALLPPVSGGSPPVQVTARVHADISQRPLSLDRVSSWVADDRAGAITTFSGVTRDVDRLEYEAYVEMALPRLRALLAQVADEHELLAIAAEHRIGTVPLGAASVVIAASSAHRGPAFSGARAAIDRIKVELPIWKREVDQLADGSHDERWVPGVPLRGGS